MIVISKLYYSVFLIVLSVATLPIYNFLFNIPFKLETSVWCLQTGLNQTNLCKFKNLCYDPQFKTLLFFLGKSTVIKGFNYYSDFQKIQLSSILQHNQFYANITMIDFENYKLSKELKIYSKGLLMSRFKPNNIMHSIHDDIFPIFLTLEHVCLGDLQCMESYHLMFHDNHPEGPFFSLYKLLSENPVILSSKLKLNSNYILCFKELLTGLILDGIFYQYGFKKPHGPVKPTQLTQNDVLRFTLFLKRKLKIKNVKSDTIGVILFKREKNRKILNIDEVKEMIQNAYEKLNKKINVNVISLDLFSNDHSALINAVSQADGLIGVHGAEMILSLFLKPNSYVVEIFPFGIKPEVLSFVKPISELEGSNFIYFSWRNMLKNNSVAHPDAHPLFGGISHLDEVIQKQIKNVQEVPPFECCNNPLFLYHMYQDTLISNDFRNFFQESLFQALKYQKTLKFNDFVSNWFYPYTVSNVSCNFQLDRKLHVSWCSPFNVKMNDLEYSLYLQDKKGLFVKSISTDMTVLEVEVPDGINPEFEMWISVYFKKNGFKSPDLYVRC